MWVGIDCGSLTLPIGSRMLSTRQWTDKDLYAKRASFIPVDMNPLPAELLRGTFDFTWSSSSLEHVGTCELGLEFFLNAMSALKPGGIALHTTPSGAPHWGHNGIAEN